MRRTKKNNARDGNSLQDRPKKKEGQAGLEDDIEAIFSSVGSSEAHKLKERKEDSESDEEKYFSVGKNGRRYHEGLPIYTPEELHLGNGGDTEDCPIYCDCCM
ncbi:uncharacterized protein Eint_030370 [Encephalitozoon intestinalis ATCC 50506]|uniref:DUF1764 domain-containing protein n=1 Tax=Encephalitozoon intestinalis (strain ATCC 50506) TaxID=876142 RepID=E0S646_ENCIT|nr:uncharacterized protein Eint_030370 [Encephalitozoon intestinalis ATCC 50506]ADM11181.1 hypothetical protein Eint_030370 [Encephalitozoon intestinalis ATCC 50506]UTX44848.1 DUF1764 domain-containing protein [Encephalitozoon intestinalis]